MGSFYYLNNLSLNSSIRIIHLTKDYFEFNFLFDNFKKQPYHKQVIEQCRWWGRVFSKRDKSLRWLRLFAEIFFFFFKYIFHCSNHLQAINFCVRIIIRSYKVLFIIMLKFLMANNIILADNTLRWPSPQWEQHDW